jgi:hypothetical protein
LWGGAKKKLGKIAPNGGILKFRGLDPSFIPIKEELLGRLCKPFH